MKRTYLKFNTSYVVPTSTKMKKAKEVPYNNFKLTTKTRVFIPSSTSKTDWQEEFDTKFPIWFSAENQPEGIATRELVVAFITALIASEKRQVLEEVLSQGSGGGNWRRIITMKLNSLKEE